MKKKVFVSGLILCGLFITGCSKPADKKADSSSKESTTASSKVVSQSTDSSQSATKVSSKNSASESAESSAASQATPSDSSEPATSNQATTALWSPEKQQELASFMKTWGQSMGQTYQEATPGSSVSFYGAEVPDSLLSDTPSMIIAYNEQPIRVEWSATGDSKDIYNIVDVYTDSKHLYLFAIYNGQPLTLVTEQNQGNEKNYLYFKQTDNKELSNGFAGIVNK